MTQARDITIIGAGIVGVCCALYLQADGHRVTLLERDAPGEGCSKGNAGLLEGNAVVPIASPGILKQIPRLLFNPMGPLAIKWPHLPRLLPWLWRFVSQGSPERARVNAGYLAPLVQNAMAAYDPLLRDTYTQDMVRDTGWMWVFEDERTYRKMHWELSLMEELGVEWERCEGDALFDKAPGLSREVALGLYFPTTRVCVNPHRFVQRLAQAFKNQGGQLVQAEVRRIEIRGDRVVLQSEAESYPCQDAVIAAGAWSGALARQLGEPVPLNTERGYHVMLPHADSGLPVPLMFAEHKFTAHQMEHGLRLAGTAELGGLDRAPDWRRAEILLHHGRRLLAGLDERDTSRWMGFRPTLPDSLPVIGPSTRHRGIYYAFGHQHLGLTLGAITGQVIAAQVGENPTPIPAEPYHIRRFLN